VERSNHAKFDELYRAHATVVQRCVASLGLPRHTWPDILQDVWMTACRRLDEVTAHPRPSAWLCTVARNHAMHHVRAHLRHQRKLAAVAVEPGCAADDPIRERDAWETLTRLLAGCPLDQREVYLKIELHGMTAGEVAEELGISVNTVHSRLRLTRQRLRESSAALAALLLLLRARLDAEGLPAQFAAPLDPAAVVAGAASRRSSLAATAGKVAVIGLVIAVAAVAIRSPGLDTDPPTVDSLAAAPEPLEPVHPQRVQRPWAIPATAQSAAQVPTPTPLPTPAPTPLPRRPRAPTAAPPDLRTPLAPQDDGEQLLAAAQTAYREARFERALQHAEQHRRRYPASELSEARETLIVQILCRLGRDPEARAQLRAFARESPDERAFRARLATLAEGCR
jgi:RNA polymerase sigma-70 factor (ECF subfamily)